ncbi:transmembrane protein 6/97 [Pyronema omphalodes]|nr:transmembrane protein 6/97 [Pyronema omphalodes]
MFTTSRPRDKFYILFLISFIPTILFFDSVALYPEHLIPTPLQSLQIFYHSTFHDPLLINRPPWFHFFSLVELFYQFPAAVYIMYLLKKRSYKAAPHTLVWATIAAGTTATCVYEFAVSDEMDNGMKWALGGMYGCYGLIFTIMAGDMFCRISRTLRECARVEDDRKML